MMMLQSNCHCSMTGMPSLNFGKFSDDHCNLFPTSIHSKKKKKLSNQTLLKKKTVVVLFFSIDVTISILVHLCLEDLCYYRNLHAGFFAQFCLP